MSNVFKLMDTIIVVFVGHCWWMIPIDGRAIIDLISIDILKHIFKYGYISTHFHIFINRRKKFLKKMLLFLAHLSTKCSWWAIVTGLCPSSVVVRRPSCVVRRASSVVRKHFYLNIFSSETTHWILTKLHRNDPWVVPYQTCSNRSSWLRK